MILLTLKLFKEERFSTAPLGVQANADGRLHGGLAEDVSQGAAVQVISQHVSIRFGRGEVL